MKQAIMKKWVKALRSGKYWQSRGSLKGFRGYCCLGVLCDISGLGSWEKKDGNRVYIPGGDKGDYAILPEMVRKWAGLKESDGTIRLAGARSKTTLADMNDHERKNFQQIADVIEKNWRRL